MHMDKGINIYLFIFLTLKQSNKIGACHAPLVCNANLNRLAEKENINATYILLKDLMSPYMEILYLFSLCARLLKYRKCIKIPADPFT